MDSSATGCPTALSVGPHFDIDSAAVGGQNKVDAVTFAEGRAMALRHLLQVSTFEPDTITVMTAAYEEALRVLGLADCQDPIAEIVARKIIEVAQTGERDPVRLRRTALDRLGIARQC